MLRFYKMHLTKWLLILAGIESAILFISFYIGLYFSWVGFKGTTQEILEYLPDAFIYCALIFTTFFCLGLYNRQNIRKYVESVIRIVVGFSISFAILTAMFYSFPAMSVWRSVIVFAIVSAFIALLIVRYLAIRIIDIDLLKRRIVVVGVGDQAARLEALTEDGQALGFVCIGYIDFGCEEAKVPQSRVIPRVNSLIEFVRSERVDEIVVAVQDRRKCLPLSSLAECRLSGIIIVDYLTFYSCETGRMDLDAMQPGWFLFSDGFRGNGPYKLLKRAVDIVVSMVILSVTLPVILIAAMVIWLDSPGPILLRQPRVGLRGEPFILWKFRTMQTDAEDDGVPRWAAPNDPRVTAVGAFLRRTRIDEIPQLFNILKGDMSFVGPRPERGFFVEKIAPKVPFYVDRHSIKPGLTGWAQLHYPYGASIDDARKKLQYDLYYVIYCGFMLDMLIILQTIRVIIWPNWVR